MKRLTTILCVMLCVIMLFSIAGCSESIERYPNSETTQRQTEKPAETPADTTQKRHWKEDVVGTWIMNEGSDTDQRSYTFLPNGTVVWNYIQQRAWRPGEYDYVPRSIKMTWTIKEPNIIILHYLDDYLDGQPAGEYEYYTSFIIEDDNVYSKKG